MGLSNRGFHHFPEVIVSRWVPDNLDYAPFSLIFFKELIS